MTTTYRIVAASPSGSQHSRERRTYYPFRVMGGLGIAQMFLGVLAISMQIVALCTTEPTSFLAAGIWGGVFFIAAGALAFVSTRKRGKVSWSIAVMVVSIFAILVALGILAVASIGLHLTSNFKYNTEYPLSWKTLESLLVVIALVEALVAFITSLMACKGIYISCQIPKKSSRERENNSYMYVPKGDPEVPSGVEMRHLATSLSNDNPPTPPPRGSFPIAHPIGVMSHGIPVDHEDFEPPPAYSEVHNS